MKMVVGQNVFLKIRRGDLVVSFSFFKENSKKVFPKSREGGFQLGKCLPPASP